MFIGVLHYFYYIHVNILGRIYTYNKKYNKYWIIPNGIYIAIRNLPFVLYSSIHIFFFPSLLWSRLWLSSQFSFTIAHLVSLFIEMKKEKKTKKADGVVPLLMAFMSCRLIRWFRRRHMTRIILHFQFITSFTKFFFTLHLYYIDTQIHASNMYTHLYGIKISKRIILYIYEDISCLHLDLNKALNEYCYRIFHAI